MAPRAHMRDEAQIGILTTVESGFEPTEAYVGGGAVRCKYVRVSQREVIDGNKRIVTDIMIHFPAGTVIDASSRIKLNKRNRTVLSTPEYFDILGEPWNTDDNRRIICACQTVPKGAESWA